MSTEFETTTTIEASPDKVWETLGDLEGISNWAAIITDSPVTGANGVGAKRECTLFDGVVVKEEILGFDDGETLRYSIGGDLPVRNMVATWTLRAESDATVAKSSFSFLRLLAVAAAMRLSRVASPGSQCSADARASRPRIQEASVRTIMIRRSIAFLSSTK